MGKIKDKMIKDGNEDDDGGYDHYQIEQAELEYFREKVITDIKNLHEELFQEQFRTTTVDRNKFNGAVMHDLNFHAAIWKASTETLPNLEVQVVIDNNNNCFVSTGSPGYVDFFQPPVGMTLPIRCWIHTHPFGTAYFSGTDIRTVSIWEPNMECAYVLGDNQYGFWENRNPKQLEILVDNELETLKIQTWGEEE